MQYAFRDRKNKKRSMRSLWIARISAAAKLNQISYSKLINCLSTKNIKLDRKILSDISIKDDSTFNKIVEIAKS